MDNDDRDFINGLNVCLFLSVASYMKDLFIELFIVKYLKSNFLSVIIFVCEV